MQHSHYGPIYSQRYDVDDERQDILAYYIDRWRRAGSPTPVLEPMCGTGFFLVALLRLGADIDGMDSSEHMLRICQEKVDKEGGSATLYHQRLEELKLRRQYRFMLIPDRSFAHLYDKSVAGDALRRLFEHLSPGGELVLDVSTLPREGELGDPGEASVWLDDRAQGSAVWNTGLWLRRDEGRVMRHCLKQELFTDGVLVATEFFNYNERFYDLEEFQELLEAAGFEDIEASKGYEGGEIRPHDVMVFSGRKPK